MELTIKQTEALDFLEDKSTREVLIGGGAGGGKSALLCYFALKQSLKYPGSRGMIGRAVLKTLRETTLNTFYDVAKLQGVYHTFKPFGASSIKFRNGSEILLRDLYAYPSDPEFDELGSLELTWAVIDQAEQITQKAKNIVKSRIRYKLDEFGLVPKLGMGCNPKKNWLKTEFYDQALKGTLSTKKKFVQALLSDNPFSQSTYEESLNDLDKASRERLLFGNWEYESDPSSLMSVEAIEAIFSNDGVKPIGNKYISADIARMGTDKTVIRLWHGWRVIQRVVLQKSRTTAVAQKINELANDHAIPMSRVICDEDGVGGGVVDILNCKGFVANARPFQHDSKNLNYDNLKAQCAWYLAKMVNQAMVYEKCDADTKELISEELEQIKKKNVDRDGKNGLMSKDQVKTILGRSPDDGDTYIMRAWFDLSMNYGPSFVSTKTSNYSGRTNYNL